MKWLPIACFVGLLVAASPAVAADPGAADIRFNGTISTGEVTPTPEMWFYQQQVSQYHDPKLAVRQKAEQRSAQRRARIAARKWFGLSNARPTAGTDVVHGDYGPGWTSGSPLYPFRWGGGRLGAVVVYPARTRTQY
ncbi:MAG: hypothetical protein ACYTG0_00140 [Planctomycetota bacterium]|jgi:hypothetical protein